MTPEHVRVVQSTWVRIVPIQDTAAGLFYGKLFELDSSLRSLFPEDMQEQGRKLMQVLNTAVNGLSRPEQLLPTVRALGSRHVGYGVKPEHYATVGTALLWTLEQGLGEAFTEQAREGWASVYGALAGMMKEGAATATA